MREFLERETLPGHQRTGGGKVTRIWLDFFLWRGGVVLTLKNGKVNSLKFCWDFLKYLRGGAEKCVPEGGGRSRIVRGEIKTT